MTRIHILFIAISFLFGMSLAFAHGPGFYGGKSHSHYDNAQMDFVWDYKKHSSIDSRDLIGFAFEVWQDWAGALDPSPDEIFVLNREKYVIPIISRKKLRSIWVLRRRASVFRPEKSVLRSLVKSRQLLPRASPAG